MLTFKEYRRNYLDNHPGFPLCTNTGWSFLERAYDDYVEQQEITFLKKENEKLKERIEFLQRKLTYVWGEQYFQD